MKTAVISGITGQDGSILAEFLLEKNYYVIGLKRRTSLINTQRVDHLYKNLNFKMKFFDLNDVGSIYRIIEEYQPDEFYNMAAQSHVRVSFEIPENTVDSVAMGTLRIIDVIKDISPRTKFYQASSSEMFGDNPILPLNEESKFCPASPYACGKVFAYHITRNYRNAYGLHFSNGVLFNHESEKRGETFITRKITLAAARIRCGLQDILELGNLDASRDWGYAKDYMEAAWLMLQQSKPDDYVIATGETHSVREFLEETFELADLDIDKYVKINPIYYRPQEVPVLLGDASKAKKILGWEPKVKFKELVKIMYENDLNHVKEKEQKNGRF